MALRALEANFPRLAIGLIPSILALLVSSLEVGTCPETHGIVRYSRLSRSTMVHDILPYRSTAIKHGILFTEIRCYQSYPLVRGIQSLVDALFEESSSEVTVDRFATRRQRGDVTHAESRIERRLGGVMQRRRG